MGSCFECFALLAQNIAAALSDIGSSIKTKLRITYWKWSFKVSWFDFNGWFDPISSGLIDLSTDVVLAK